MSRPSQDKRSEIEFFAAHAAGGEYNVFSPDSSRRIFERCLEFSGLRPPGKVVDLGCASGIFTAMLAQRGFDVTGVDIAPAMIELAEKLNPGIKFVAGDAESLPFENESLDGILFSAVLHHFPDPGPAIREAARVLKPGGKFVSFDPNRLNPIMYLYRDPSSPFYSRHGVTPNERPVLAGKLAGCFRAVGLDTRTDFLGGIRYRYVASPLMRRLLPVYNVLDGVLFNAFAPRWMRSFVIMSGRKPGGGKDG